MAGPFPYSNNIPQSTDQISQSQSLLLQNFQSIKLLVDQNHGDFSTGLAGQHTYVQIPQTVVPGVTPNEVGLYNVQLNSVNQMWIRKADGTPDVPITASNQAQQGWAYLPSGILLKWGNTATVAGLSSFLFPTGPNIPVFNTIYQVIISTIALTDSFVALTSFIPTQINYSSTKRTSTSSAVSGFTYLAIGK